MAQEHTAADFDDIELRRLISAWSDGAIEGAAFQRLQSILATSARARVIYLEFMDVNCGIQEDVTTRAYLESFVPIPDSPNAALGHSSSGAQSIPFSSSSTRYQWLKKRSLWAAGLLIGFVGGGLLALLRILPIDPVSMATNPVIARVVDQSADCRWGLDCTDTASPSQGGDSIRTGETIRVGSGQMRLAYGNGITVTLYSPALYQVISETQARVLLGKVSADIGTGPKGFSILTPRAVVVDLGTQFGINVTDVGSTDVVVIKGKVNVNYSESPANGSTQQRELNTGEAVHFDASGTESRITAISSDLFSDRPDADSAPVIASVRDNVKRDAWNYYEIVHAGMREDAKAFVDRESHEWNGITSAGMPAYLLGGDYVKTFNNDKSNNDLEIRVILARPAKLYVLFDDRMPVPAWLLDNFHFTGDHIGIDEGPYLADDGVWLAEHQPSVGAGVSIDNTCSVWVREVKERGPIVLGATEAATRGFNMYGIVAVALDESTP